MNFLKVNLRLKLDDLVGTKLENDIIDRINYIYEKVNYPFKLYLWIDDNNMVGSVKLKEFVKEKLGGLPYKTIIKPIENLNYNDFSWFDLVSNKDKDRDEINLNYRFRYIYYTEEQILKGLEKFESILSFCLKPKPKRQKRNDYED